LKLIDWIEILFLTAFGLAVAYLFGAFRRKSIFPPRRLITDRSSPIEFLLPALAGFCASLFAPAIYFALVVGKNHQPNSHQTVCAFALGAGSGLLMIQTIETLQEKNNLRSRLFPDGIVYGVVGGLAIIPLVLTATSLIQGAMSWFHITPPPHPLLLVFQDPSSTDRLLVILSAVILAPLFEELVFRAHVQSAIRKYSASPWLAVMMTSALFALVHQTWWMMPPLFVLALGMGYVYERTRNIWATITIHAAFNALSLTVEYISMRHH
jgi:membrane protease YdiL (CAAX protease family)